MINFVTQEYEQIANVFLIRAYCFLNNKHSLECASIVSTIIFKIVNLNFIDGNQYARN